MTEKPISLCMFSSATARGGAEEHILQLLHALDRERFRLHLACTPELTEMIRDDVPKDVKLTTAVLDHVTDVNGAYRLWRFLRQNQVQILHSHMFRASLFASPLAWLARVPVRIETSHGREVWREGKRWPTSSFWIDRAGGRIVTRMIAVSEATKRWLVECKRLPANKIVVIHTAVNLSRFAAPCLPDPDLTRLLGFADDDPVLLVLGRLEPQKGHRVLIDAMARVVREFPRVRVVCLGEGSLRAELQAGIKKQHLQDCIRLIGYRCNVREWLALATLSVLPSFYEGMPLAAIESLAAGCPIVATAVDGTPEVVIHEKTGLLIPAGDPARLADAICRMLRDPQRSRQMALAGRQHVCEHFSVERQGQRTQDFYLQVWEEYVRSHSRKHSGAGWEAPNQRAT